MLNRFQQLRLTFACLALCAACSSTSSDAEIVVQAHVMPSCAFSADAMTKLVPLVASLGERGKLEVEYVGTVDAKGAHLPYGAADELAAKYQLCAHELAPSAKWLELLRCQAADFSKAAASVEGCAKKAGIDAKQLAACTKDGTGDALLRASIERSRAKGVVASPTMFVNGKKHARGLTSPQLARVLCDAMKEPRDSACSQFAEPAAVGVTLVVDSACSEPRCKTDNFAKFLNHNLDGVQLMELDAKAALGEKAVAALGLTPPFAVFDRGIEQEREVFSRLKAAGLLPGPSATGYVLPLSAATQGAQL